MTKKRKHLAPTNKSPKKTVTPSAPEVSETDIHPAETVDTVEAATSTEVSEPTSAPLLPGEPASAESLAETPEDTTETQPDDQAGESSSPPQKSAEPEEPDFVPPAEIEEASPESVETPAAPLAPPQPSHTHGRLVVVACLVLLLLGGAALVAGYRGRALPGTQLAGINVAGKTPAQVESIAREQAKKISLTFTTKDKSDATAPVAAGITFDPKQSAQDAMQARRKSWLDTVAFWRTENVPLNYQINRAALDAYLTKNVMVGWKLPRDASLIFNPETKVYDVTSAIPGEGVHMYQVTTVLDTAALHPGKMTIAVKPIPTNALISTAAAKAAQTKANEYLKSDIKMMQNGKRVFYLEPQEIDKLIDIVPNKTQHRIDISVSPQRVQEFVDTDITNTIARAARDRITITNPSTGEVLVLQEGVAGQKLDDHKGLAKQITEALTNHKAIAPEISVAEGGTFTTKNFTGVNRWAEVNLSKQEAYMHLDDQVIQTFRISSGRAATPSDPGEWAVSRKFAVTTMRGTINGESYVVPDVPWVSYFNPDGEAFHGAYWHNNFGTPMSHGCINMTVPDAHMMYNFTYIGMRVSVHY